MPRSQEASPAAEQPRERNVWLYPDAASVDQRDPTTFGFVEIGRVLGAHGVRGELKVATESDFALERLCKPGPRWLRRPRRRLLRRRRRCSRMLPEPLSPTLRRFAELLISESPFYIVPFSQPKRGGGDERASIRYIGPRRDACRGSRYFGPLWPCAGLRSQLLVAIV